MFGWAKKITSLFPGRDSEQEPLTNVQRDKNSEIEKRAETDTATLVELTLDDESSNLDSRKNDDLQIKTPSIGKKLNRLRNLSRERKSSNGHSRSKSKSPELTLVSNKSNSRKNLTLIIPSPGRSSPSRSKWYVQQSGESSEGDSANPDKFLASEHHETYSDRHSTPERYYTPDNRSASGRSSNIELQEFDSNQIMPEIFYGNLVKGFDNSRTTKAKILNQGTNAENLLDIPVDKKCSSYQNLNLKKPLDTYETEGILARLEPGNSATKTNLNRKESRSNFEISSHERPSSDTYKPIGGSSSERYLMLLSRNKSRNNEDANVFGDPEKNISLSDIDKLFDKVLLQDYENIDNIIKDDETKMKQPPTPNNEYPKPKNSNENNSVICDLILPKDGLNPNEDNLHKIGDDLQIGKQKNTEGVQAISTGPPIITSLSDHNISCDTMQPNSSFQCTNAMQKENPLQGNQPYHTQSKFKTNDKITPQSPSVADSLKRICQSQQALVGVTHKSNGLLPSNPSEYNSSAKSEISVAPSIQDSNSIKGILQTSISLPSTPSSLTKDSGTTIMSNDKRESVQSCSISSIIKNPDKMSHSQSKPPDNANFLSMPEVSPSNPLNHPSIDSNTSESDPLDSSFNIVTDSNPHTESGISTIPLSTHSKESHLIPTSFNVPYIDSLPPSPLPQRTIPKQIEKPSLPVHGMPNHSKDSAKMSNPLLIQSHIEILQQDISKTEKENNTNNLRNNPLERKKQGIDVLSVTICRDSKDQIIKSSTANNPVEARNSQSLSLSGPQEITVLQPPIVYTHPLEVTVQSSFEDLKNPQEVLIEPQPVLMNDSSKSQLPDRNSNKGLPPLNIGGPTTSLDNISEKDSIVLVDNSLNGQSEIISSFESCCAEKSTEVEGLTNDSISDTVKEENNINDEPLSNKVIELSNTHSNLLLLADGSIALPVKEESAISSNLDETQYPMSDRHPKESNSIIVLNNRSLEIKDSENQEPHSNLKLSVENSGLNDLVGEERECSSTTIKVQEDYGENMLMNGKEQNISPSTVISDDELKGIQSHSSHNETQVSSMSEPQKKCKISSADTDQGDHENINVALGNNENIIAHDKFENIKNNKHENECTFSPVQNSLNTTFDGDPVAEDHLPPIAPRRLTRGSSGGSTSDMRALGIPSDETRMNNSYSASVGRLNEMNKKEMSLESGIVTCNMEGGRSLPASPSAPRRRKKRQIGISPGSTNITTETDIEDANNGDLPCKNSPKPPIPAKLSQMSFNNQKDTKESSISKESLKCVTSSSNVISQNYIVIESRQLTQQTNTKSIVTDKCPDNPFDNEMDGLHSEHSTKPPIPSKSSQTLFINQNLERISVTTEENPLVDAENNPFDSEDEIRSEILCEVPVVNTRLKKENKVSLNPFESDEDEEAEEFSEDVHRKNSKISALSLNPFGSDDDINHDSEQKKLPPAGSNPFDSDDDLEITNSNEKSSQNSQSNNPLKTNGIYSIPQQIKSSNRPIVGVSTNPFDEDDDEDCKTGDINTINSGEWSGRCSSLPKPSSFHREESRASFDSSSRIFPAKKKRPAPLPPGYSTEDGARALTLGRAQKKSSRGTIPWDMNGQSFPRRDSEMSISTYSLGPPKRPPPPRPPPPKHN